MRQLSQEALRYTRSRVIFSTNIEQNMESTIREDALRQFNKMRLEQINDPEYSLSWIQSIAQMSEKHRLGNCCEKTCVAYQFIYRKLLTLPVEDRSSLELYNDPFSDHFFLVIGREELTDSTNPLDWNKDTIICDPWAETKVYKLEEIDFDNIDTTKFHAISNLYDFAGNQGSLTLQKEILISDSEEDEANMEKTVMQPVFVRRNRLDLREGSFQVYNLKVPMVIEPWDLPDQTIIFRRY